MFVKKLSLQQFRNHHKRTFRLAPITIIVGQNTTGKTNILEALYFLSLGKSFRAEKDQDTIELGEAFAKIEATVDKDNDTTELELQLSTAKPIFAKRFLINGVRKRQHDFVAELATVIFTPEDINFLTGPPSLRRRYLDQILIQSHKPYRLALILYEKAIKHRNRLLRDIREGKKRYRTEEFSYWNNLLLTHGKTIHEERRLLIKHINESPKPLFSFTMAYDHSTFTAERVEKYQYIELQAGQTLIGPQRDEILFYRNGTQQLIREFCSRGEQRLTILQLKLIELITLEKRIEKTPILLLDDIFSELDQNNIELLLSLIPKRQTILTTIHEEFIPKKLVKEALMLYLP